MRVRTSQVIAVGPLIRLPQRPRLPATPCLSIDFKRYRFLLLAGVSSLCVEMRTVADHHEQCSIIIYHYFTWPTDVSST